MFNPNRPMMNAFCRKTNCGPLSLVAALILPVAGLADAPPSPHPAVDAGQKTLSIGPF